MRQGIAKAMYWLISFVLIGCYFYLLLSTGKWGYVLLLVGGCVCHPLSLNMILKKCRASEAICDIVHMVRKVVLLFWVIIIVLITLLNISITCSINPEQGYLWKLENFTLSLKVVVYLVYLMLIFMFIDLNNKKSYLWFGAFYAFWLLLDFAKINIVDEKIADFFIGGSSDMKVESYTMFRDACLMPIKEAILTFIIFDTGIEFKDKVADEERKSNNRKTKDKGRKNKVKCREFIRKIWHVEKDYFKLLLFEVLAGTYLIYYVWPSLFIKLDILGVCLIWGGIITLFVYRDYQRNKELRGSLWNIVVECQEEDDYSRFIAMQKCIMTYRSIVSEEDEDGIQIRKNIYVLEARLAQSKAVMVILPIVLTVFTWFIGDDVLSFQELIQEMLTGSMDAFIVVTLALSILMALGIVVKQYPNNAFIKKVIESIREELQIKSEKGQEEE